MLQNSKFKIATLTGLALTLFASSLALVATDVTAKGGKQFGPLTKPEAKAFKEQKQRFNRDLALARTQMQILTPRLNRAEREFAAANIAAINSRNNLDAFERGFRQRSEAEQAAARRAGRPFEPSTALSFERIQLEGIRQRHAEGPRARYTAALETVTPLRQSYERNRANADTAITNLQNRQAAKIGARRANQAEIDRRRNPNFTAPIFAAMAQTSSSSSSSSSSSTASTSVAQTSGPPPITPRQPTQNSSSSSSSTASTSVAQTSGPPPITPRQPPQNSSSSSSSTSSQPPSRPPPQPPQTASSSSSSGGGVDQRRQFWMAQFPSVPTDVRPQAVQQRAPAPNTQGGQPAPPLTPAARAVAASAVATQAAAQATRNGVIYSILPPDLKAQIESKYVSLTTPGANNPPN